MAKTEMQPFTYLPKLLDLLAKPGALLAVRNSQGAKNVMTIGWANIGIIWGKPVCIVYVRPSRYTFTFLEQHEEFTVNFIGKDQARAASICGTVSGRDQDKFKATGLEAVDGQVVSAPVVEPSLFTYECRVLNLNDFDMSSFRNQMIMSFYSDGDLHRVYYGEILTSYGDKQLLDNL